MNAKQIKYLDIVGEFFASDVLKPDAADKCFSALLKLDYAMSEDLWEYMLIKKETSLKKGDVALLYIDKIFSKFYALNAAKAVKTVTDRPAILRAVFKYSPTANDGNLFAIPVNLLLSGKTETVDAIFKSVSTNEAMGVSYGEYMIKFLDRFFIESMKKSASRRVELNRKQSQFLLATVQKVHGDERAMLIQRVKEVQ